MIGNKSQGTNYEFLRVKINLNHHPIVQERYEVKLNYYFLLFSFLEKYMSDEELKEMKKWFQNRLKISEDNANDTFNVKQAIKIVSKTYVKSKKKIWIRRNYKHLLLAEFVFFSQREDWDEMDERIQLYIKEAKITKNVISSLKNWHHSLSEFDFQSAEEIVAKQNKKLKYCKYFNKFLKEHHHYDKEKPQKVAVIATMSAGKSTFLNSMIGKDVFPSENKACTAKVLEFTNNHHLDRLVGMVKGEKRSIQWNVTPSCMKKWNRDANTTYIQTEGHVERYSTIKSKITFLDTPGPNNARNGVHEHITTDFLKGRSFTKVAYILNATNFAIDDDETLLKLVLQSVPSEDIVFVLNKVDALDVDGGEGIQEMLEEVTLYLQEQHQVKEPKVVPISSYAASLFKNALLGNATSFTAKQLRDFVKLFDLYEDERYDITYVSDIQLEYPTSPPSQKLEIGGIEYDTEDLFRRLKRTGIFHAEHILIEN